MLNATYIALPIAILLGFLSGLGVGGGSLLILWLTLVAGWPGEDSRILNLLFFLPCAAVSCLFRLWQGSICAKAVYAAVVPGCIAAAAVTLLCGGADTALLKKGFGLLLIGTGLRELFYRARKAR